VYFTVVPSIQSSVSSHDAGAIHDIYQGVYKLSKILGATRDILNYSYVKKENLNNNAENTRHHHEKLCFLGDLATKIYRPHVWGLNLCPQSTINMAAITYGLIHRMFLWIFMVFRVNFGKMAYIKDVPLNMEPTKTMPQQKQANYQEMS
jgi:hypothetical protein